MAIVIDTTLIVKSPAFVNNGSIPEKFTCEGANISPEIHITDFPKETKSLALIMEDPDPPNGIFVHWLMWNIPPREVILENTKPGVEGLNSMKVNNYYGPCPVTGTHHYHFRIYALDTKLELPANTDKDGLLKAMDGHLLSSGILIGIVKKKGKN